jgi:hypothetical protein
MSTSLIISTLGVSIILIYGIIKLLDFYGIGINVYGSYIAFYVFIILSSFILPREYSKINV